MLARTEADMKTRRNGSRRMNLLRTAMPPSHTSSMEERVEAEILRVRLQTVKNPMGMINVPTKVDPILIPYTL